MKVYDTYEITGCQRMDKKGRPRRNGPHTETCDDSQAQFWTLYGHIDGEGVEAIGDFSTREHAEETFQRITGVPFTGSREVAARLRVMHAAPKLLAALDYLLAQTIDMDLKYGIGFSEGEQDARQQALAAIAEATGSSPPEPRKPIVIEVLGGVVQDVLNVPPGYDCEIMDYDNIQADDEAAAGRTA